MNKIAKKQEKPRERKEKKDENESFLERIMASKLVQFFELASRALESLTTKLNEEVSKIKRRIIKFLIIYTFLIAGILLFFYGIGWYLSTKFNIFNNGLGFVFVGFILIIFTLPIILSSAKH